MSTNSPILQFIEALKLVREKAGIFRDILVQNEAQTRSTLIDPILTALGWDFTNPTMVKVELMHEGTRLDYGLMSLNGEIRYIVEAKKLETNLDRQQNINTAIDYAFIHAIPHVALTDGLKWHFYDDFRPGKMIPFAIDLSEGQINDMALALISRLDVANFGYAEERTKVVRPQPEPIEEAFAPTEFIPVPSPKNGTFIPLDQLDQNLKGHPAPRSLRLPDGNTVPISYWSGVLYEITKFVLDKHPNLQIPQLDQSGGKVNLISYDKMEERYKVYSYKGREVYIHINYSSTNCVLNAKYILEKLPKDQRPNIPALRFD